jgi:proteasome accessory factor C
MKYQGGARTVATERVVDPYALVHRSGWWYFVGCCRLREAMRTFRVDRVLDLALTGDPFAPPENFDIHAYLAETFAEVPLVHARLRFAPEAAHIVHANLSAWDSHQEHPDGGFEVALSAPDLPWLASMVLSFSTWVTVIDPPELRDMVHNWAQGIVALYEEESQ